MTARKPRVVVEILKFTVEIRGPVRVVIPAVRQACGRAFTLEYDSRARTCRVTPDRAADVIAALEAAGAQVDVRGRVPERALW